MRAIARYKSIVAGVALGLTAVLLLAVFARAQTSVDPWLNLALSAESRANLMLKAIPRRDKVGLMHGVSRNQHPFKGYLGYVPANARLHIPALKLADGRAGVGNNATRVTLLPA